MDGPLKTVFLTKARVAPWELEDRVLMLMDEMIGKSRGEQRVGSANARG